MSDQVFKIAPLFNDVKTLIDSARQRAAVAVNAELTMLYWQVGQRIRTEVLGGERAKYGQQIIAGLAEQLTTVYGKGWSLKQLHHCLRFAETFPDPEIVSALRRQLSWTHIKALIYIEDPLKRDFYTRMAELDSWSTRTLSERIDSMLFERSALSKKPEEFRIVQQEGNRQVGREVDFYRTVKQLGALKGHDIRAQGTALGNNKQPNPSPERATHTSPRHRAEPPKKARQLWPSLYHK